MIKIKDRFDIRICAPVIVMAFNQEFRIANRIKLVTNSVLREIDPSISEMKDMLTDELAKLDVKV